MMASALPTLTLALTETEGCLMISMIFSAASFIVASENDLSVTKPRTNVDTYVDAAFMRRSNRRGMNKH